jgi:putative DNA primase/helicase
VFFVAADKEGNSQPQWICSPLAVVAKTRDAKSREWGRLLRWNDADSKAHEWAMPLELLQGDGAEVRCELARRGLEISPARAARERLTAFLNVWPVEARARCVDRLGYPTLAHGGLSLLEVAVPYIELSKP